MLGHAWPHTPRTEGMKNPFMFVEVSHPRGGHNDMSTTFPSSPHSHRPRSPLEVRRRRFGVRVVPGRMASSSTQLPWSPLVKGVAGLGMLRSLA